jgi:glycosyltransferase involved in cell wall biosynthesis
MKISIITVVFNSAATIKDCIHSVAGQRFPAVEHIVIDGKSTDGSVEVIERSNGKIAKFISEPDDGMYDAMNKGIRVATGDIIGILNSDDIYADEFVLGDVVNAMEESKSDSCYGDLVYVERYNMDNVRRHWNSGSFRKENFRKGWMPPHPTFFVKREIYEKYGLLNTDFPLAADYELMLRFLYKHNVSSVHIPRVLVKMRAGGTSRPGLYTVKSVVENYRSWTVNGLPYPVTMIQKPFSKIFQYFAKGSN